MTVSLSKEQVRLVRDLGRYKDDTEVVKQGLRLLQEYESRLSELRAEIQKG